MANTTNFNWETPDDTDLVKDGAAAIRTLAGAIDTSLVDLKGGTTGQVLSKATGTDMDFTWVTSDDANAIQNAIVDAKGDIIAASAADTPARLAVGTDNQRVVAASGEATGLKYVADTQNTVVDAEGDLLVGDSADTLQRLAIGSNTHVLTVDTSVDGKIKWAAPAGGGGMTLLSTTTLSGASVSLSGITSTYKALVIYIKGFRPASNNATMQMRFNGQTATRYENRLFSTSTVACTPTATSINVMPAAASDAYGPRGQGQIVIPQYYVSSYDIRKMAIVNSTSETGPDAWNQLNNVGYFYRDDNGAITSIDLFPSTGNFTDGTILLYGVN
jgi:hypothetical protein